MLEESLRLFGVGVFLRDHPLSAAIIKAYYAGEWPSIFAGQSTQWISKDADSMMNYLVHILEQDFEIQDSEQYVSRIIAGARGEAAKIMDGSRQMS